MQFTISAYPHLENQNYKTEDLIALCQSTLSDGSIDKTEAETLLSWLQTNNDATDTWPANVIYARISAMLEDNILDSDEQAELLDLLVDVTEAYTFEDHVNRLCAKSPINKTPPEITYNDRIFSVTGKFATGSRKEIGNIITQQGGEFQPRMSYKTNYLVIGEYGSRDWISQSFGRKIEGAIAMREKGMDIAIISEKHWISTIK